LFFVRVELLEVRSHWRVD